MEQNISIIKMATNVASKVELAKAIINVSLCFNNIKLSDTEATVLSYFMVYGVTQQTKTLIVNSKVCKNLANIKTVMVKLKRLELIYKDELNSKVYVTKSLNINLTPVVALYLKLEVKS